MGVTHIVIHPTSRLTLLLSRRVLSRAPPPRAAFSGGRRGACSRAARVRVPAVGRSQPQIGCVRGASGLSRCCCCRQLVGPMAGPHVQRQGRWQSNVRQLWAGSESKCAAAAPSSELCALCHGPTPLPRLTRPASCAACWLSVSIDTANLLWLAVVSLAAASLLLLLTVVAAATWRGVADGASRDEGLLQRSGGPATRLGSADPVIGPSRSVEESGGARARRSRSP